LNPSSIPAADQLIVKLKKRFYLTAYAKKTELEAPDSQCPMQIHMHDENGLISTGTGFFYSHAG
jgi:hypothetical protein